MSHTSKKQRIVISASRRTDIPAFYMEWFMKQIGLGQFEVINPFNRKVSYVPATPEKVHTIVFWSKNFRDFIDNQYGEKLKREGYNLFFNFTINSPDKILEPNIPDLNNRLDQIKYLADSFGNECINWRLDPLCHYINKNDSVNNLSEFNYIARSVSNSGVKRCITSFVDIYGKVQNRCSKMLDFEFTTLGINDKIGILTKLEALLDQLKINLMLCCENELFEFLPPASKISQSSCIDNILLKRLYGDTISIAKDSGQRTKLGCGCKKSYDIGSYESHPCSHNCLYCYANPKPPAKQDYSF